MSQWDKLLKRLFQLDNNMRFGELAKILEYYGYTCNAPGGGSSHFTFRKAGCNPITIPRHKPIKKVYIEMVRDVVESEANTNEDNR